MSVFEPAVRPPPQSEPAPPLLDPAGPRVVLGGHDPFAGSVTPTRSTLFGPRGAVLLAPRGPLVVSDTGHHRLLGWNACPDVDGAPADWIIGQPTFEREGRNAGHDTAGPATLNVPTGVAGFGDRGLIVADAWNNRVLIWRERPAESGVPADIVLGQADFHGQDPNRGGSPTAETMHWPFQVLVHDGGLVVADAGNRRVLIWDSLPTVSSQPADRALGQPNLESRSDNAGVEANAGSFRWPHDLAMVDGDLLVADAGDNRVLVFEGVPGGLTDAKVVVGQPSFTAVDHNQGRYWPEANTLNMPYGLAVTARTALVADTANSRLLGFELPLRTDQAAASVSGQDHFQMKGDNKWKWPTRDSLCWPYGVKVTGDVAVVSDSGNHRVVLWTLAP